MNNPLIVVLVLLLLAVVGAMQFGLLDELFGAASEPPPAAQVPVAPHPSHPAGTPADTPAATAGSSGDTSGQTPAPETAPGSGSPQATAVAGSNTTTAPKPAPNSGPAPNTTPAAQGVQAAATNGTNPPTPKPGEKPAPRKLEVPEFSFAVGRTNPFANLAGISRNSPGSTPTISSQPARTQQPASSGPRPGAQTEGQSGVKPKAPWESWQFTGLSTYGKLRIAIIETPSTSYIVKVGDRIEGVWLVEEITSDRVTLKSPERTLVLVLGGDKK